MQTIETQIDIDAPPERVWAVLADTESFPEWNPFVTRLEGPFEVGEQIRVELTRPNGKAMTFTPKLLAHDAGRELRWIGKLGVRGVFDGEHEMRLEPGEGGGTRFIHREQFTGAAAWLMMKLIGDETEHGFRSMNEALKARVESTWR